MLPSFELRLLQEYVGEEHRRDGSRFTKHVHAVIDFLDQHLVPSEHPGDRHGLISDVCETFIRVRYDWNLLGHDNISERDPDWRPAERHIHATSFLIAILRDYERLQSHMLRTGSASSFSCCRILGPALQSAIRHGHLNAVRSLDPNGTQIVQEGDSDHWNGPIHGALRAAAKGGHLETIRWVLPHLHVIGPPYESICYNLFQNAAIYNQPEIAGHLLDEYRLPWDEVNVMTPIAWLCRHGQEDLVRKVAGLELLPTLDSTCITIRNHKKVPLEEAAAAGHIGICRFLLDEGKASGDLRRRASTLFYAAVRGGNLDILRLFEERGLGKIGWDALVSALPAAAARGHMEMARYIVEMKYDARLNVKNSGWLDTETIRSYALLRAVIGHQPQMIRWLVEELGTTPDGIENDWEEVLNPLNIAINLGKVDIVELLLRLGATPTEESLGEAEYFVDEDYRYDAREALDEYRCELKMVAERQLSSNLVFGSKKKVEAALAAVDPDVSGIIRLFGGLVPL
ncbi:ankyrin repeat-containing domain protein [Lophiotrema nucula]|uniref:Ankyrin repeat-containing domain protein n=1 Tax=Lophiotrema nucula TaxID=690887 RepID=A0A6A5ZVQ8_9PLEO|nr:ankyrin repeat-containing domain protein [Lophiotrema nucula]